MVRLIPVSNDKVAALLREGKTAQELADLWGVQTQTVWKASRLGGYAAGQDVTRVSLLPVFVSGPRAHAPAARGLRALARVRAGEELKPRDKTRFENWLKERDETGTVVEYDEDCPANPASPTHGGWHYETRRPDTPEGVYFQSSAED